MPGASFPIHARASGGCKIHATRDFPDGLRPTTAVGQYGSIAVIERFIRTLKDDGLRRILVPLTLEKMRAEANAIIAWYNTCRPHTALGGRTPEERYRRIPAACRRPRFEPRPRWPAASGCASPPAKVRGDPGVRLQLHVDWLAGQKHLPVVTLKRVA